MLLLQTSAIPRVSLSCDHLSAVWCLQFMQVINRFLFNIAQRRDDGFVIFSSNKQRNMQSAVAHFVVNEIGFSLNVLS